ncbi:PH domain-containing protein [Streptomyces sp. NPDC048565]|uniref:PH domain-containing protein n=1 Tax=Streptomyces sp. NPDC048565 TaxID=3155266 RepID=UPI00343BA26B
MTVRGRGQSKLTPNGISFRYFLISRSIPWKDISGVEMRHHTARSNEWWDLRIVRTSGRTLVVPGAFTSRRSDPKFEVKFVIVHQYWMEYK